jgi:Tfp pilus assembly protein PilP
MGALMAAAFFATGTVGCGGKSTPPEAPAPEVAVPTPAPGDQSAPPIVPQLDAAAEYTYRGEGRRDPFVSLIRGVEVEQVAAPEEAGPFVAVVEGGTYSPLARFDLEELKLVGIVDIGGAFHGLVEVADGKSYFLRNGTQVGRNGGVVSRVLDDRIVITETYRNPLGETRTKDVYLTFAKKGGD